jgi:serine/threonine-protein kinase RsbW
VSSAPAEAATRYHRTFHGRADQVSQMRHQVASYLAGCPAAADAVLIASELATNAIVHSASSGEFFTVRCETHPSHVWIEVEDLGGPWKGEAGKDRLHGPNIIGALTGPDNWGVENTDEGNRIVWARLILDA